MNTQFEVSIPIETKQFLKLVDFLRDSKDLRDPVLAVRDAIDYWIGSANLKPELLSNTDAPGYQWKSVFLPEGTQLRMPYKGKNYYAKVEGDQIIYEGQPISPGSLANKIANSSRNAWRDLWIKFPGDKEWILAYSHRWQLDQEITAEELGDFDEHDELPVNRVQHD